MLVQLLLRHHVYIIQNLFNYVIPPVHQSTIFLVVTSSKPLDLSCLGIYRLIVCLLNDLAYKSRIAVKVMVSLAW